MKKFITLLILLSFLTIAVANVSDDVTVNRIISGQVVPGEEIEIKIEIIFNYESPSSVIITEEIPAGFEITQTRPKVNNIDGKQKWLIYGNSLQEGIIITYKLKAPNDFSQFASIRGTWATINGSNFIQGDSTIVEKLILEEQPEMDYTIFIAIGIILIIIIVVGIFVVLRKKKK